MKQEASPMKATIRALLILLTALVTGCAWDSSPSTESVARTGDGLTFPVTITLSTPAPVVPTAPVIVGSNSVSFGARAQVVSGVTVSMGSVGLTTEPDVILNETWSRGLATLKDRSRVQGTLHARTRSLINGATVTTWDQNPTFDPPQTMSWKVSYPSGTASNVTLPQGSTTAQSIQPGKYGIVTLNSNAVLTLSTGTYYLTSLAIQAGATVKLDQANGPITIYVTDGVILRGSIAPVVASTSPNLLIAHLGTQPIFVESRFDGALIAPSASLTLRSVTGTHTGYFYAKDPFVDAGAKVAYRTPLGLIRTGGGSGPSCRAMLPPGIPETEVYRYCPGGCIVRADTDRDGVEDCVDECPYDPNKTIMGACPCNTPNTDTDHDGTPDCLDDCDLDPNATAPGPCGCISSKLPLVTRAVAGTKCISKACPGTGTGTATCDGAGVCGNRAGCIVATGCRLVDFDRSTYQICTGPVNQAAAVLACRSKQLPLVRINGFHENEFLMRILGASSAPVWIGANSITSSGVWRWTNATSNNGDQFWQGGATGAQTNDLFSSWAKGSPGAQRCTQFVPKTGRWVDVDCNQNAGFVCEYNWQIPQGTTTGPQGPSQPSADTGACVTTAAAGLPPEDDIDAGVAQLAQEWDDSVNHSNHHGSAAAPPDAGVNTCNEKLDSNAVGYLGDNAGCMFSPVSPASCVTDSDCAGYGPDVFCRRVKNDLGCEPSEANPCSATSYCGTFQCPTREDPLRCDQREICNPTNEEYTVSDVDSDSDLTPDEFDPAGMFDGGLPVVAPAPSYDDPPKHGPLPKDHAWCFMDPQKDVPDATQPDKQKKGKGGGSSRITFGFDPHLEFKADINPVSLGESDLKVNATASLVTSVTLNKFINQTFTKEVIKAVADIRAERCTVRNDQTQFTIFGKDFIDLIGIEKFNTGSKQSDWYERTNKCNNAVGTFIEAANRAKKAFRDVQQMMKSLDAAKTAGGSLRDLCTSVMEVIGTTGVDVPFFPGGFDCPPNEPAEVTINRFLDYYQAPGYGAISTLRDAMGKLSEATAVLRDGWNKTIPFGPEPRGESKTVVRAQFQIGPVPCMLEIEVFYAYGAAGFFQIGLHFPFDPFKQDLVQRQSVADVRAGVMPFASAGLSAFVGAGRSLGPFNASLGIEGSVTLGDVKAPIFGGAGVGMETTFDDRPPADDINPLAQLALQAVGAENLTHFGRPKSAKFFVWYNYGAALELRNILGGEIKGRLRIKFAFFSRTWRKRIVKFNGFSKTFPLLSGKAGLDPAVGTETKGIDYKDKQGNPAGASTLVAEGTNDVGMSEPQVPLLVMQPLEAPAEIPPPHSGDATFDKTDVQGMFYDSLCCAKPTDPVTDGVDQCTIDGIYPKRGGPVPCCPGFKCKIDPDGHGSRCQFDCRTNGQTCGDDSQCCPIANFDVSCGDNGTCQKCGHATKDPNQGAPCNQSSDCCGFDAPNSMVACSEGHTCVIECHSPGYSCTTSDDCCPEDHSDVWCDESNVCQACGHTANDGIPGGSCNTASDCCDFASDPSIVCNNGECQFGSSQ